MQLNYINDLMNLAVDDLNARNEPFKARKLFYTIDQNNIVSEHTLLTSTAFNNRCWTIACTDYSYSTNFGMYINYDLACIVDKNGSVVNTISLDNWSLIEIRFETSRDKPRPKFRFAKNNNLEESIELSSVFASKVQHAWNFFIEINQKCNTIREAEFYRDYFISNIQHNHTTRTLDEYRRELNECKDLIKQHRELIEKLEDIAANL